MERIGAGFIALLAALMYALFDLTASLRKDQQRFDGQDEFLNALVRASLVFRHEWGLVRVSLMYVEDVGGND